MDRETVLRKIDDLPKVVFSRLKGKLLADIEELVGEKLLDQDGNAVTSNGRVTYKPTVLLQALKTSVSTRLQMLSADLKNELELIKQHV